MQSLIISDQSPIRVWSPSATWIHPHGGLLSGLAQTNRICCNIIEEWVRGANEIRAQLVLIPNSDILYFRDNSAEIAFDDLLIKCTISYITMFLMLENGFKALYEELNKLNKDLELNVKHEKIPTRDGYIRQLWLIRNKSIAHWADTTNKDLDRQAGLYLGGYSLRKDDDLVNAEWGIFGVSKYDKQTGKTETSQPRRLKSLPETHLHCSQYIRQFDNVCSEYLKKIQEKLPLTKGDRKYTLVENIRKEIKYI